MKQRTKISLSILASILIILLVYFLDNYLLKIVPFLRISFLDPIIIFLGGTIGLLTYLTFLGLLLLYEKKPKLIPYLILTFIFTLALIYLLKYTILRPRPDIIPLIIKTTSSFPSAHAAIASSTFLLIKKLKHTQILAFIPAVIITFSGFYNGVHYLSDILTGIFLGIIISYLTLKKGHVIIEKIKHLK